MFGFLPFRRQWMPGLGAPLFAEEAERSVNPFRGAVSCTPARGGAGKKAGHGKVIAGERFFLLLAAGHWAQCSHHQVLAIFDRSSQPRLNGMVKGGGGIVEAVFSYLYPKGISVLIRG
jgi:hypothetical protein